jgi:hypothetical protein
VYGSIIIDAELLMLVAAGHAAAAAAVYLQKCPMGTSCKYAHGHFELWLHPGRFRTKMCSLGDKCRRPVCFFAHSDQELRTTPYSSLDTSATVAAQQLAELQHNCSNRVANSASSISSRNSCDGSTTKPAPSTELNSPCGSEASRSLLDRTQCSPACSSDACDDPLALWTAALASQAPAPVLDSYGLQLQSSLMADAAAELGEAAIAATASSLWLANSGMLPQPGVAGQLPLPAAATSLYSSLLPQQQLLMANSAPKPLGAPSYEPMTNAGPVPSGTTDLLSSWLVAQNVAPAGDSLRDLGSGNPLTTQQVPCAASAGLAAGAPVQMPCMPMRSMMQQSALEPWLRADIMPCYPPGLSCTMSSAAPQATDSNMLQFLSSLPASTVQQLLGMLAVDAQPTWGGRG